MVGHAMNEATGSKPTKRAKNDVSGRRVVVLGSGNLGLVYLMQEKRRLTLEEIEQHHPRLIPGATGAPTRRLAARPLSRARPEVLGANGTRHLATGQVEGEDPLAPFSPHAAQHLVRTDGFEHVADIMVGSFTTWTATKAAPSKSSSRSTVAWEVHRHSPSSCTPPLYPFPRGRSSAPRQCMPCSRGGARLERGGSPLGDTERPGHDDPDRTRVSRFGRRPGRPKAANGRSSLRKRRALLRRAPTLLLELAGARLLTDPVLGRGIGHLRRSAPRPGWRTWRRSTRCWFHTPITTISIPRRYGRSRASAR